MKKPILQYSSLLSLLFIVFLVSFMAGSCEKPEDVCTCEQPVASVQLQGTKWKLEGVVNLQTGEMQVLEPVACESCYTLQFNSDTIGSGRSASNTFYFNLKQPQDTWMTLAGETGDGDFFTYLIFIALHEYEYEHDSENAKFKFFCRYENIEYCLLYKKLP
jgi:hypothetical protein